MPRRELLHDGVPSKTFLLGAAVLSVLGEVIYLALPTPAVRSRHEGIRFGKLVCVCGGGGSP